MITCKNNTGLVDYCVKFNTSPDLVNQMNKIVYVITLMYST